MPAANLLDAGERRREVGATDDRLNALLAEYEQSGEPQTAGRIAFLRHEPVAANPHAERGLCRDEQCDAAISWDDGWDIEWRSANPSPATQKAA